MSCMAMFHPREVRTHHGLRVAGMVCANSSCLTMTSLGFRAACHSHVIMCRLRSAMLVWPWTWQGTIPRRSLEGEEKGETPTTASTRRVGPTERKLHKKTGKGVQPPSEAQNAKQKAQ